MKRFVAAFCGLFLTSAVLAEAVRIPGDTPAERVAFLTALPDTPGDALARRRKYLEVAVRDPAYEVREYAAWFIRGNEYIGTLVQLLSHDPDARVRASAAMSLDHWLTDNGVETCTGAQEVVPYIDALIRAAGDLPTAESALDILGFRYSGDIPLACCMQAEHKRRILAGLARVANKDGPTAKHLLDQMMHSRQGGSFDFPIKAQVATKNILECAGV